MKDELASHNLRGLELIADLYILGGILVFGVGVALFVLGSLTALLLAGFGIIMIATGYYLDDLRRLAWIAVIITNFIALTTTAYSAFILHTQIYDPTFIINVAISILCIGYLLRPQVRNLFFEK
ncbi:MAG: hypothetical protein ACFFE2_04445 [Candidatus Thorarchaeota archaeon]